LGEEPLGLGWDCLIAFGDEVPGRSDFQAFMKGVINMTW
jgi:hypothetical protein